MSTEVGRKKWEGRLLCWGVCMVPNITPQNNANSLKQDKRTERQVCVCVPDWIAGERYFEGIQAGKQPLIRRSTLQFTEKLLRRYLMAAALQTALRETESTNKQAKERENYKIMIFIYLLPY